MKILITYDLRLLGSRFARLKEIIDEHFPNRWHCFDTSYVVSTDLDPNQVRDLLLPALNVNDCLLVSELGSNWAGIGISEKNRQLLES
ncbi:hypothetical protein ACM5Q9_12915 [Advenella sp. RU8]|uniref:hypothetical protein n=1 Tax=Advenella sp. RU8 TaxID=3399575 RepID=UPI003AAF844B